MSAKARIVSLFGILFLAVGIFISNASADGVLSFPGVTQEQVNWCWGAASRAILLFYGNDVSQCTIADWARQQAGWGDDDCCTNPGGESCNRTNATFGVPGSIQDILYNWNVMSNGIEGPLPQSTIVSEIDLRRPFVIRWAWMTGGGHAVIVHGIIGDNVYYMDPNDGYRMNSYSWMVNGSNHIWTRTLQTATDSVGPNTPSLISPVAGSNGISTAPVLDWSDVSGSSSYDVEVCNDSNCSSLVRAATVTGSQWVVSPALSNEATYYWRVKARNNSPGIGQWSISWSFTTQCPSPEAPLNKWPSSGAVGVSTGLALSWTSCANTESYDVYFGTTANPPYVGSTAGTSYILSGLSHGTTYYWKVAARNYCGRSPSEGVWSFSTYAASVLNDTVSYTNAIKGNGKTTRSVNLLGTAMSSALSPATLVSPFAEVNKTAPTYAWNAVPGATWYQLYVNDSTGNKIQKWYPAADVDCPDSSGTCSVTPTTELVGSGQWWVQTYNSVGYGPWSAPLSFTVSP